MTWIRAGQLTAETRSVADVAQLAGAAPTASNNKAMTGQYSYRGSSAAFGLALGHAGRGPALRRVHQP